MEREEVNKIANEVNSVEENKSLSSQQEFIDSHGIQIEEGVKAGEELSTESVDQRKDDKLKKIKDFIDSLKQQIAEKDKKIKEYEDLIKRLAADFDNYKKKVSKEKIEYTRFANKDLILDLLPIIDNFDRAVSVIENTDLGDNIKDLFVGIKLIHKELINILLKYGVVKVDVEGRIFDPSISEVIEVEEVEGEDEKDIVVKEYTKAYKMYDQVIRPAKVKVQKRRKKKNNEENRSPESGDVGDGGVSSSS
ncbi:MAG: nucleotide exchange factor GrpE [Brevinematia bacterium]